MGGRKRSIVVFWVVFGLILGGSFLIISKETSGVVGNRYYVGGSGPANYTRIQDAIDNASAGDTVIVFNGTYYENVIVEKQLMLKGVKNDGKSPVIDANSSESPIKLTADNIIVEGFTITNSGNYPAAGIYIESNSNYVLNNTLTLNQHGIGLHSSRNNTINDNCVIENNGVGLALYSSNNNNISGNYIAMSGGYGFGIVLDSSCHNNMSCNDISDNDYGGVLLRSSSENNIIHNNSICSNGYDGINLDSCSGNIITKNNISNHAFGFYTYHSDDNTISTNFFSKNGLWIVNSYQNNVTDNIVNGKPLIYLENESNEVIDGGAGQVILVNCNAITVKNQSISNTDVGIELWGTYNSVICRNNISETDYAIDMVNSNNNHIIANSLYSNNHYGMGLYSSYNNLVCLNDFFNNPYDVNSTDSSNSWSSNFSIPYTHNEERYKNRVGNYWERYSRLDYDNNGIGDSPYSVPNTNNQDLHPLVKQWNNANIPPIVKLDCSEWNPNEGQTVNFTAVSSYDIDGIINSYEWDWNSDNVYEQTGMAVKHSWSENGTYNVTLRITDDEGAENTEVVTIIVGKEAINHPPAKPTLHIPSDGSVGVGIHAILRWASIDPEGHDLKYDVYIGTNNENPKKVASNITSNSYELELNYSAIYYWKITAWDVKGANNTSEIYMFTTIDSPQYVLNSTVIPAESGHLELNPAGGIYDEGTIVTVTARPIAGYEFEKWSGDINDTNPEIQVDMDKNTNIFAHFIPVNANPEYYELNPIADSYVDGGSPHTNYGSSDALITYYASIDARSYIYLKFDLSNIPEDCIIRKAQLKLNGISLSAITKVDLYSCSTTSWREMYITYDERPSFSTITLDSTYTFFENCSWDITQYAGNNLGKKITLILSTSEWADLVAFCSKENSHITRRPKLSIDAMVPYTPPPPTPPSTNTVPTSSLSGGPASGYAPLDVTFSLSASDSDGSISSWQLDIDNDGITDYSGSGNPPSTKSHTYQDVGTYPAKLTVADNDGATDTDTVTITVNETPNQAPAAGFDYTPSNPTADTTVDFTDNSTDSDGDIENCTWDFGDGVQGYGQTTHHTYNAPGTYNVTLNVTDDDGDTDSYVSAITVEEGEKEEGTPGFGLAPLVIAIAAILLIKRRNR